MHPTQNRSASASPAGLSPASPSLGVTAELTRTCQPVSDTFTTAALVGALEACWAAIRTRHPEVPAAIIIVASGSPTKARDTLKWGHFASLRWQHGDTRLPEVLVSGEGLSREPDAIFTTLLHEATHALADVRDIRDTSRQGRWHNQRFAKLAAELGMDTTRHDKFGFSPCTLRPDTTTCYQGAIGQLAAALGAWRHPDTFETKQRTSSNNGVSCECECPRKIRIATSVFEAGPILCAVCDAAFLPDEIDREDYQDTHLTKTPTATTTTTAVAASVATEPEKEDAMVFYDPTGARYGLPTYPYQFAPEGLATVRQLRSQGLRPGGQDVAAQILWRHGRRVAYLYRIDAAKPKRTATAAQRAALDKALLSRRTCTTCGALKDYYIPRRYGECLDCTGGTS